MSENKPTNQGSMPDIESSLTDLLHAPSPEAHFVSNLERSLVTRARQESQSPSWRQRFSGLFASSLRGVAWGVGALLMVVVLAWGIRNLIPVVLPAAQETPTPANMVASPEKKPTQVEGSKTYTNQENSFTFSYPGDWTVEEAPHYVFLHNGPFRLVIAFRRPEESHSIQPTGLPSGEYVQAGSVQFLDQAISRTEVNVDNLVKRVFYNSAREIQFKDIAFVLLLDAGQNDYAAIDIPEEVQAVADQVLASFSMPGLEPLPDILSNEGLGRVAYIMDGDLWIKPLPDGEPIRLTTDGANSSPLWSPSGRWLGYRHGEGQVNLIRTDGSAAHDLELGPVIEYAWSPTADRLAFSLGGDRQGELWVINADGTGLVSLVPQEAAGNGGLSQIGDFLWHPLGGQLLYYRWSEEPYPTYLESALWEVNAFTGDDRRELLRNNTEKTDDFRLAGWLAGGKSLLLWLSASDSASLISDGVPLSAWPYHLLPFDGNPLSEWPYPLLPDEGDFQRVTDMLPYSDYLSADPTNTGRLAAIDGVGRETWAGKSLFLWDYTTGHGRSLTGNDQAAAFPTFSANGMRLAYVGMAVQETGMDEAALRQAMLGRDLYLFDFRSDSPEDPGDARQLTNDPAYRDERPEWSQDGKTLLFPRLDAADNASLWLAPVDGGDPFPVVDLLATEIDWFGYYGYIDWDTLYDWWQPPAAAPDEYPPLPDMPESNATPAAALEPPTQSFSEAQAGYTFDYPQGWYLNSVPGSTEISSSDPSTWAVKGSLPLGETQVVFRNDATLKGAAFADVRRATLDQIDLAGERVLNEDNWSLPGEIPALRMLVSGPDGEYAVLVTVLNGAPLQVFGFGDLALFDAIIATLR